MHVQRLNLSLFRKLFPLESWLEWVGLVTLVLVTFFATSFYEVGDIRRWLVLLGCVVIIVLELYSAELSARPFGRSMTEQQIEHGRLLIMTVVTLGLVLLDINFTALIILYFVFSAHALAIFPNRAGYLWVLTFGIITTAFVTMATWPTWQYGFMNGLGATCGYFFMGSAANAQRRAELAGAESRALLAELQTAHRQLQAYASRAEELAVAQERNRMAREMHDALGHRLTVAAVQLEGAQKLIRRDPEKAIAMVGTVREQVVDGLSELRQTVTALRAPVIEESSLGSALGQLVANFMEASDISVQLQLPEHLPELSPTQQHAFYRAAQESLTNVQRHAHAKQAAITLSFVANPCVANPSLATSKDASLATTADWLQLSIEDDGCGVADEIEHGFGLHGLDERASAMGGHFQIEKGDALGGLRLIFAQPIAILEVES